MTRPAIEQFKECVEILKIAADKKRDDDVTTEVMKFIDTEVKWLRQHSDANPEMQQRAAAMLLGRTLAIFAASCLRVQLGEHLETWLDQEAETYVIADLDNRFNDRGPT